MLYYIVNKILAQSADEINNQNISGVSGRDLIGAIYIPPISLDFVSLITIFINWIIYLAAVLAFLFIVYAGIMYITSGGNAEQAKKGQQALIYAIIGIIIIVLSYAILRAANFIGRGVG